MIRKTLKTDFTCCLFLCVVALGLSIFCLALALVCSRQHIIKHGYSIGNLEHICFSYGKKISEVDRKILSMSTRSKIMERVEVGEWKLESAVVHVSKRDMQRHALITKRHVGLAVAKNFSRAN
ncbi:MAG: hypothetical protein LBF25_01545 [Puniceicoccales bacterium]|nr:hypothetical protein [Puniceicoccales bacterium]